MILIENLCMHWNRDASELTMHKMLTKLMKRTENSKEVGFTTECF